MIVNDPTICPFCGAASRRSCDLEDDCGYCPAEEAGHNFDAEDDEPQENQHDTDT